MYQLSTRINNVYLIKLLTINHKRNLYLLKKIVSLVIVYHCKHHKLV